MRLLRCHIENFGTLSDYDFDFSSGLTTICEENGFGKSTFAAFIKAMFYGFPRTGARNIVENERKRYDPWQGGKYGGFLEFETENTDYRVTRYFGKTAAKDTFSLLNLTSRQLSSRFSEKLGEELFQLDADSFARSTYMPQLSAKDMEATTSIRTKLSDLVEDTNDLCNYDTAERKLREYRTKFKAYRGTGGIINDLDKQYNDLESKKFLAEQQKPHLLEVTDEIDELNSEKALKEDSVKNLREKIRIASNQKAQQMRHDQLKDLRAEVTVKRQNLEELDANYPAGYPTPEEIRNQRENISIIQQEGLRLKGLKLNSDDKEIVEKEKDCFVDIDKTVSDIEQCDKDCKELGKVSAKLTSQMLPEELKKLDLLNQQFEDGVPTEDSLKDCLSAADTLADTQRQLSETNVPVESQECLSQLKELFKDEIPDETILSTCEQNQRERDILIQSRATYEFPEEDLKKYQSLQRTFASGIPSEEDIQQKQKDTRRIAELTTKKNTKTTILQEETVPSSHTNSKSSIICGGLGIGLLAVGVGLLITSMQVFGIVLLVVGLVCLIAAVWLHTKNMVATQSPSTSIITASAITNDENQELYDLQHSVNDFLLRFYENADEPENKLVQLLIDRKSFVDLSEKKQTSESKTQQINQEIDSKDRYVRSVFERYYPNGTYTDGFIQELRDNKHKYESLSAEANEVAAKRETLYKKINEYRSQIISLLQKYYPIELPNDLRQGVRDLAAEVKTYNELKAKKAAMIEENAESQARADKLASQIREVLLAYSAMNQTLSLDSCLQTLRKRFERYKEASERVAHYTHDYEIASARKSQAETAVETFLQKYQLTDDTPANLIDYADEDIRSRENTKQMLKVAEDKLSTFLTENPDVEKETIENTEELPDPEILQLSEKQTQQRIDEIDAQLRGLRQERDKIRSTVESISIYEDSMNRIETEQEENEKKCSLAEKTLELLSQAKDNLANSYVGKVERGFIHYANTLMEGQLGRVMVDKDLKLHIDEKGAAREVGSFSSGTIDCIMLCMRLSLVDALFTNEKPFLILDDPFVNMDDKHTKRALEMLNKVAEDHQVVYMVCNSSRK